MATVGAPPPPPRLSGDPANDQAAVVQWAWDFYESVVIQNYYVSQAGQFDPGDFDPSTLPDPATATIASAQQTANEAYALAVVADEKADEATEAAARTENWVRGTFSIADANTSGTYTFTTPQADNDYNVFINAKGYTGTPASVDSTLVIQKVYSTNSFSVTINAAPGVGNSVIFDFILVRNF
jgi:hypothetical protein